MPSDTPDLEPTLPRVRLPEPVRSPWLDLGRRHVLAFGVIGAAVALTLLVRDGYVDGTDPTGEVSVTDAIYYATVSLSTTGYGDITPVTTQARMVNAFLITPLRVAFLVLLIGTTVEVLATRGRDIFRAARWRRHMKDHVIVIGYGTKGRSAVDTLISNGIEKQSIMIVDPSESALRDAHEDGLAVVTGDATRRDVLRRAGVGLARQVIITTNRDDSTILATLNVRQINADAHVVAAVREQDHVQLLQQSGADSVVISSEAVGRLLGLSSLSPTTGSVLGDLLTYGTGLEVAERDVQPEEVGKQPQQLPDQVIAVVRDGEVHRYFEPAVGRLAHGDRLVVVRPAEGLDGPRPGTED